MATKTISLELDAYEKLRRAKRSPRESFSAVVRRASFEQHAPTARDLLDHMEELATRGGLLDGDALNQLDRAQDEPRRSRSHWDDPDAI